MSPEQIDGRPIEGRSDIFALGAVLYEMADRQAGVWRPVRSSAIVAGILHRDPGPVSAAIPNVPPSFDRLVRTCLEKDPERRWQSAHDVSLLLAAIAPRVSGAPRRVLARVGCSGSDGRQRSSRPCGGMGVIAAPVGGVCRRIVSALEDRAADRTARSIRRRERPIRRVARWPAVGLRRDRSGVGRRLWRRDAVVVRIDADCRHRRRRVGLLVTR